MERVTRGKGKKSCVLEGGSSVMLRVALCPAPDLWCMILVVKWLL